MIVPSALFGVIGYPLAQSLSPLLHNWAFRRSGVAASYMAFAIAPERLADFFTAVRTLPLAGGNITIPHKVAAMEFLDGVSERARRVGAVNTFFWEQGALRGENTDVPGFLAPIKKRRLTSALVLGAGGAARAVLAGLRELGVADIAVANRTAAKAEALAAEFGARTLAWDERGRSGADMLVNTTSQGMTGKDPGATPFPKEGFRGKGLAYDIVYNPLETRFLRDAREAGWDTQDGLAMFVEQARESFRIWNRNKDMPAGEAASLLREHLETV